MGESRSFAFAGDSPIAPARLLSGVNPTRDAAEIASDNAEDFKQGAKINKASVSRRECVGTLLKILLC
jgi:hypothetical protein